MTAPQKPKPAGKRITVRLDATDLEYMRKGMEFTEEKTPSAYIRFLLWYYVG